MIATRCPLSNRLRKARINPAVLGCVLLRGRLLFLSASRAAARRAFACRAASACRSASARSSASCAAALAATCCTATRPDTVVSAPSRCRAPLAMARATSARRWAARAAAIASSAARCPAMSSNAKAVYSRASAATPAMGRSFGGTTLSAAARATDCADVVSGSDPPTATRIAPRTCRGQRFVRSATTVALTATTRTTAESPTLATAPRMECTCFRRAGTRSRYCPICRGTNRRNGPPRLTFFGQIGLVMVPSNCRSGTHPHPDTTTWLPGRIHRDNPDTHGPGKRQGRLVTERLRPPPHCTPACAAESLEDG